MYKLNREDIPCILRTLAIINESSCPDGSVAVEEGSLMFYIGERLIGAYTLTESDDIEELLNSDLDEDA